MIDIIVFLLLLLTSITIGLYKAKAINTEKAYLLANRETKLFPLVATLVMTEFNPSTLIGFSALGYIGGYYSLTFPLVFLIGLLFYTFSVASKWKRLNSASVSELFRLRYGKEIGMISSGFLLIAMFGFSANYIKSLEIFFQSIFQSTPSFQLGFMILFLVLLITLRGGLYSIIKTDIFAFIITLIILPTLYYFSMGDNSIREISIVQGQEKLPISFVSSLIILTMFTYISAPWYGQKIFSAKSEIIAFQAVGISSVLVFILYAFPLLSVYNLFKSNIDLLNPELGIPYIFNNLLPSGVKGFAYFVVMIAGVTTLSGVWSAMTTMIINDFFRFSDTDNKSEKRGIIITLLISTTSFFIAEFMIDKILNKLILANIPIAALSFGLLSAFYWKKSSKIGVVSSLVFGFFWGIFCYIYFGEEGGYTFYWGVIGIPLIFIIGIVGSILFPPSTSENEMIKKFNDRMN
jgi:solute:Na+ symporter, SSS family